MNNLVQAAFIAEQQLIPGRIKTNTSNGVVSLFGELPESQAVLALETVTKVPGVKQIKNLMNQQLTEQENYPIDN